MKRTAFILGSIEAILGLLILCTVSMLREIMPLIGYAAFQAAAAGSYSPGAYALSFTLPSLIAVILVIAGAAQLLLCLPKGTAHRFADTLRGMFQNATKEDEA